jgi:hypothetical protein
VLFFLSFWKKDYIKTEKCTCDQGKKPGGQTKTGPQQTRRFLPKTSQNRSKLVKNGQNQPVFKQKTTLFFNPACDQQYSENELW